MSQPQKIFPQLSREPEGALEAEPVMLDGMKVLFDMKVGLYPVRLEPKGEKKRERNGDASGRNGHGY